MKTHLQAKVEAVNQVNAEINRIAPLFREAVKPFIGKKVLKVGGFTAQLKKVFPEIKAGMICPLGKWAGKLKGPITAITPRER